MLERFPNSLEVQKFTEVLKDAKRSNANEVRKEHCGNRKGRRKVQITSRWTEQWNEFHITMHQSIDTDRASSWDESQPIVGENNQKDRGNEWEKLSRFLFI